MARPGTATPSMMLTPNTSPVERSRVGGAGGGGMVSSSRTVDHSPMSHHHRRGDRFGIGNGEGQVYGAGGGVGGVDVACAAAGEPPPVALGELLGRLEVGGEQRVAGVGDLPGLYALGEAHAHGGGFAADGLDRGLVGGAGQ